MLCFDTSRVLGSDLPFESIKETFSTTLEEITSKWKTEEDTQLRKPVLESQGNLTMSFYRKNEKLPL